MLVLIVLSLNILFWNGLFVYKDMLVDVCEKIIVVVQQMMVLDCVKELVEQIGVIVYWQDVDVFMVWIVFDIVVFDVINVMIVE